MTKAHKNTQKKLILNVNNTIKLKVKLIIAFSLSLQTQKWLYYPELL